MTKRGPDSVTIALEELMRMEDERLEEEQFEQEHKETEIEKKKLKEQKRREVLTQALKDAEEQERQEAKIAKSPLLDLEEELASKEFDVKGTDLVIPWYRKRNFKTGVIAFVIALSAVAYLRFQPVEVEEEYVMIPEYVTIQEYEELENKINILSERITRLNKIVRKNEKIADEKHLQIYNRVGLYDIRAHERVDTLEDRISDLENPPKKAKLRKRKTKKKLKPERKKDTGLSDDPMGIFELSER